MVKVEIKAWEQNESFHGASLQPRRMEATNGSSHNGMSPDVETGRNKKQQVKAWWNFGSSLGAGARSIDRRPNNASMASKHSIDRNGGSYDFTGKLNTSTSSRYSLNEWSQHLNNFTFAHDDVEEHHPKVRLMKNYQKYRLERDIFGVYFSCNKRGEGDSQDEEGDAYPSTLYRQIKGEAKITYQMMNFFSRCLGPINATMPWLEDSIDSNTENVCSCVDGNTHSKSSNLLKVFLHFVDWCLRGIGQVYFCNNPMSGLLILIGLLVQSTHVALYGIIALLVGTTSAYFMGFDISLISSGLFGYNAVLVGLAIATFTSEHEYSLAVLLFTILTASLSTLLFVAMSKVLLPYKSPPFTLPFNVATLIFLSASANMNVEELSLGQVLDPVLPNYLSNDREDISAQCILEGTARGIGQVFLADNLVTSGLMVVGLLLCSRVLCSAAVMGSLVGVLSAITIGISEEVICNGLYSYCSSLTFTAVLMFYTPSFGSCCLALIGSCLTVLVQAALDTMLDPYGLPVMTLPFCMMTLVFILIQGTTKFVIAVPLESISIPEDHLRRVQMLRDGFAYLLDAIKTQGEGPPMMKHGRRSTKLLKKMKSHVNVFDTQRENDQNDKVSKCARKVFIMLDKESSGSITSEQFKSFMKKISFDEKDGLEFSVEAFKLMSMNGENLGLQEFIAFSKLSYSLFKVRELFANFIDFVDVNNTGLIDVMDLNSALSYLEEIQLTADQIMALESLLGGDSPFDSIHLINFVCVATLKELVLNYHERDLSL